MKARHAVITASLGLLAVSPLAGAADLAAAATTQLGADGVDTMTAIGGAMLGLAVVAVVFKWAKGAIFG